MTIVRTNLRGIGIASSTPFTDDLTAVTDEARHVEQLGFTMLWRSGVLPMVEAAVDATDRIPVGTGIVAVSNVPAPDVVATYRRLERDHPGRFVVGLGGAHDAHPLRTLGTYLDVLDDEGVPAGARVLAALGPNMLSLARDRASGAYPYLVTPSYVTDARDRLGEDRLLAVLLMTVASTDRDVVRRAAAEPLGFLTRQGGYRNNLLRLGFETSDIDGVSDRLLDGITAWGEPDAIAARIADYHAAGADQVVLRILDVDDDMPATRERLAQELFG
jgi:probable F420-dependent oxidoreductase